MSVISVNKKDGTKEEVEIVTTFKIEKFGNNDYVIYKQDNRYFGAKYIENNGITELIVDELTKEEKKELSIIFERLHKGGLI